VRPPLHQIEIIAFADRRAAERRVVESDEPIVSSVLPQLKQTPESMLNTGW
jgi:hypothetical protein